MTIPIPLRPPTSPAASGLPAPRAVGLTFPIGISAPIGGVLAPSGVRPTAQLLAITAAAAADDPADALLLARLVREKPEEALTQPFDVGKVKEILAAITEAQDDPSKKFDPTEQQRAVAAAVGANSRLVAAAAGLMDKPAAAPDPADATKNTRGWSARRSVVALGNADLLDRAARAARRAEALAPFDVAKDVKTLQADVTTLKTDMGTFQAEVTTLKTDAGTLQTKVRDLEGAVIGLQGETTGLRSDVDDCKKALGIP